MTREELTAIVAGIIQGVAIQGVLQRKGQLDLQGLAIECVDQAEALVQEAAKSPEQRADERTAREVARKMTEENKPAKDLEADMRDWARANASADPRTGTAIAAQIREAELQRAVQQAKYEALRRQALSQMGNIGQWDPADFEARKALQPPKK